jgi:DNA-binding winged helix-turn-helix (wHTH) protein
MDEVSREQLEMENELMKQQLSALTGSNRELGVLMALKHGMTQRLAIILYVLVGRAPAVVSKDTLHSLFYADRNDGGPDPSIFGVHITRLRGVLRRIRCPGKIDTVWNAGYKADPDLVNWVKSLYNDSIPQEK